MAAVVTPAAVRLWAAEKNIPVAPKGRIPDAVVKEFNKGRRSNKRYVPATPVPVDVKVGRKTVSFDTRAARAWAVEQGMTSASKGRLSTAVKEGYAATLV